MRLVASIACALAVGCGGAAAPLDGGGPGDGGGPTDGGGATDGGPGAPDATTIDGPPPSVDRALCDAINQYRADHGLAAVPVSPALTRVARFHVEDLTAHGTGAPGCNLHSWSTGDPRWTGCCYTPDHAQAQCMWIKPREISAYMSSGYEIAAGGGGAITPTQAVGLWDGSTGHREVVLNQGAWATHPWRAVGCAIETGYAVVWFGELADPG
ncbi:MAG: CAP domain-containing protein [Myxococcales bacterium]|nr:CAP domain-containing protein [Myxococcales bacterium]